MCVCQESPLGRVGKGLRVYVWVYEYEYEYNVNWPDFICHALFLTLALSSAELNCTC